MSRKIGYARVSTKKQSFDIQVKALVDAGVKESRIFSEKASGKNAERPELQRLLAFVEPGDEVICCKMDRLGRNTADMIRIIEELSAKDITVVFIDDKLNTAGTMGKMVVTILAAVAQAERERIMERTNAGLEAAKEAGIAFGPKPHKATERVVELFAGGASVADVMKATGVSRATAYRIKSG